MKQNEMGCNIVSEKMWLIIEPFSMDFLEESEKLRK